MKRWKEYGIVPAKNNKNADDAGDWHHYYCEVTQKNENSEPVRSEKILGGDAMPKKDAQRVVDKNSKLAQ